MNKARKEQRKERKSTSVRVGRVGMRADKMDMEADMKARGASQKEEEDEGGSEGEEDDDDDERLRLDELLDELDLLDHDEEDNNNNDGDNMTREGGHRDDDDVSSMRILTVEEANRIAPLQLPTTGFDMADYASGQFKFT